MSETPVAGQLPLALRLRDAASFDNFYPGANAEVLQGLAACAAGAGQRFIYVWGEPGSGKTHLLQAACHAAAGRGHAPAYLPLAEARDLAPAVLEGLERSPLVCLDDVQAIAGQAGWEQALFHLFNRIRASDTHLVVAATDVPAGLGLVLPDLASRLAWGVVYRLQGLDDAQKLAALRLRARRRGFELGDEVGRFLLQRVPRDMTSLFALLDRLDDASLVAQRRLTIPFVRDLLG